MVRTVKSHQEHEEMEDEDFTSHTVKLDGKNNDNQKVNALRSKHSETEQRRRSKINERFQILRDLIPENDQKRDKASFLLEVIQYIQFLQEKIQMYEGAYQGWNSEPFKLMPWRSNSGPVENFVDQPQFVKNGSSPEDNFVVNSTLLSNSQNSMESDLGGDAVYRQTDHPQVTGDLEFPLNLPVQPNLFEVPTGHLPQGSFSEANHLASDSRPQFWSDKPCSSECAVHQYHPDNQEQPQTEDEESNISSVYSQGLLCNLAHVLQSSGVDLSQASISVQLEVGKWMNSRTTKSLDTNDSSSVQRIANSSIVQNYNHISKKPKTSNS